MVNSSVGLKLNLFSFSTVEPNVREFTPHSLFYSFSAEHELTHLTAPLIRNEKESCRRRFFIGIVITEKDL
jgi:hypothetical protein